MAENLNVVPAPQFVINIAQDMSNEGGFAVNAGVTSFVVVVNTSNESGMTDAQVKTAYENNPNTNEFDDTEQTKLAGIQAGATDDQTGAEIKTAYELEADTNAFNDAAVSKLAAIEDGATADQTDAQIRTAVEAATDSNVFNDADHSKLNAIEASATADQSDAQIETAYNNQVAKISGGEITAGTEVTVRRFSPDDVEAMIAIHSPSGGPSAADIVALSAFTPTLTDIFRGVDDPAGTPVFGKTTYGDVRTLVEDNLVNPVTSGNYAWLTDVFLERDGAGTLAQRDGANNQRQRWYAWYTDASNGEWGEYGWTGGVFYLGSFSNGTGSGRAMGFITDGVARWAISATGDFAPAVDNIHDIGLDGSNRPKDAWIAGTLNLQNVTANKSSMVISGYSLTGANAQNMIDLSGTWNTTGAPTMLYADILDTASDAGAMLINIKVGGVPMFGLTKAGHVTAVSGLGGMSDSEVKTAYENNADTNEFDDAEQTKLAGIETAAKDDQTDSEIETAYNNQVPVVSGGEMTAGTEVAMRRFSPDNIENMVVIHAPSGSTGWTINDQTGTTYTLLVTDTQKLVRLANGASIALTVPTNAVAAFAIGAQVRIAEYGVGTVTIDGAGVTLNVADDLILGTQYEQALLIKVATNEWDIVKDTGGGSMSDSEVKTAYENNADTNAFNDAAVSKLAGIETSAKDDQTNAEIRTAVAAATDSNVFTDSQQTSLGTMEDNAKDDQTDSEIRTAVEAATDSNVFTDNDHSKLNAIEASATTDQTDSEIRTAVEAATDSNVFTDADHTKLNAIEDTAVNLQTGTTYTLVIGDANDIVEMANAATNVLTIPLNASVAFAVGTVISVIMMDAGVTSITGASGVTLNGVSAGSGDMTEKYAGVSIYKRSTDEWVVNGGIGTVA